MDGHQYILEEAVSLLADLPENHKVFITSGRPEAITRFENYIQRSGLVDVKVIHPKRIIDGGLHEAQGILLISEPWSLDERVRFHLYRIKNLMEKRVLND